ncbi:MAG: response regulator [Acidobacteria bacterium]|nr:response regulator [Acidobacteriota bacterium]
MDAARILIVEDERITAEDLHDILAGLGYSVTGVVSSGAEALELTERERPDLVMMDVHIQGELDGIETARLLRQRFDIPVIYLTAHADQETLGRAKIAEPLGYIVKPFQEAELQASIEMALHKQATDRERKEKERRLITTLSALGQGVISLDREAKVTYMNPAAEYWTGWKLREAAGAGVEEVFRLFQGANRTPAGYAVRQALEGGVLTELEGGYVLLSRSGAETAITGSASPIRDHHGAPNGAVILFASAAENRMAATAIQPPGAPEAFDFVTESPAMKQIVSFSRRVARSEVSTILLEGESGVGKDVLAKLIHYCSQRREHPFLAINCAAIPETLLESELFGYEKGAFTDARAQKKGILELATGGTVLLDEIGEMPLPIQAKLLRVLEEQSFRRLGGTRDILVDLRVITATNRDLKSAMEQGRFRLDLYYRLNVIQIQIPPLRERREDILPLVHHFIQSYNRKFRRSIRGVAPEAVELMLAHNWPGNVRELRNMVERAMVLEEGELLQPDNLKIPTSGAAVQIATQTAAAAAAPNLAGMSLEGAEKALLLQALERSGWNQTRAAQLLSISRDTLRYRMKKFKLVAAEE